MGVEIRIPDLGISVGEVVVTAWLKAVGDRVHQGEPICSIEAEKAQVEIESPADGVLARILVAEGQPVPVGTVIGLIA